MNNNRMTIKDGKVFKLSINSENFGLSHSRNKRNFYLAHYAKPRFEGTVIECMEFIKNCGAEFAEI